MRLLALLLLPEQAFADGQRIPMYLFDDWRYWAFLVLYTFVTVRIVRWAREGGRISAKGRTLPSAGTTAACLFFIAIAYQIAHHLEHLSQIYQYWYLGLPAPTSRGIIFFLDLEWNHFIFDGVLFFLLYFGALSLRNTYRRAGLRLSGIGRFLLASAVLIQGWHAVEHTYRITRHVQWGCEPCAGIMDQLFDIRLIFLHFWFNVLALTLPLTVFAWYGMREDLRGLLRGKPREA